MEEDSQSDVLHENHVNIRTDRPFWGTSNDGRGYLYVNLTVSCESHFSKWIASEDSRQPPRCLLQHRHREEDRSIVLTWGELADGRGYAIIESVPLTSQQMIKLLRTAHDFAKGALELPPRPYNNVLILRVRVRSVHKYTYRPQIDDAIMSRVMRESLDEEVEKVPATEADVEMVMREKVELSETETCSVCLEEVREGVQMPCSHVFHGDCMGEWLRNDHQCPVCRFELPAAMEATAN